MMATTKVASKSSIDVLPKKIQPSRKGKKAWRKNIDIDQEEEAIQELVKEKIEYG